MKIDKLSKANEVGFASYSLPAKAKRENRSASWFMKGATILSVLTLAVSSFVPAFAAPKPKIDKIDICHATGSNANPYTSANADQTADAGGHDGHDGPVWFSGITVSWGDIIPPFNYDGGSYPGKNWTSDGQAILANGCNIPTAPTTGSLTVTKNTGNAANNAMFTFTVSGGPTSVSNFQITTVGGTGSHTINNLAPGTYTIGETSIPTDWAFIGATSTCDNGVAVTAGQTATCTMVNNYSPVISTKGSLKIIKETTNGNGTFNFNITGPTDTTAQITTSGGTGETTINNLEAGSYTVSEDSQANWALDTNGCDDIDIVADQTTTCTITNTYTPPVPDKGSLQVTKIAINGNGTFSFTGTGGIAGFNIVTTDGSGTNTITNLTPGSYSITEGALPANWSETSNTCTNVSVASNQQASCVITNTYTAPSPDTAELTLVKQVSGGDASATDWTLTATGPTTINGVSGSGTVTNASVNVGTYDLSESGGPGNYSASDWVCMLATDSVPVTANMSDGDTVSLTKNQDVTCTITNTYTTTPTYSISGKVYHDNNSQNGTYDGESEGNPQGEAGLESWTVYLDENDSNTLDGEELNTLSDANGNYEFTGLAAGCYTVREVLKEGWAQTEPTEVDDFEYEISLGAAVCSKDSLITQISGFFIKTAQAQALPTYNFGNIETSDSSTGGGGGSRSGSRPNDGRVLGDSTGLPYQAPEGQVLGASTLPVTGHEISILFMILATAGFVFTPLVVSMATKRD